MIDDKKLYELMSKENKNDLPKCLNPLYDRFSFTVLKNRDFHFDLGHDKNGELGINGNCYGWSNAFVFEKTSLKFLFEIMNYHNKMSKDEIKKIVSLTKKHFNKLFFVKTDSKIWIDMNKHKDINGVVEEEKSFYWYYFPNENYQEYLIIKYKDGNELEEVLK